MVKATGEVELLWSGLINSVKQNGKFLLVRNDKRVRTGKGSQPIFTPCLSFRGVVLAGQFAIAEQAWRLFQSRLIYAYLVCACCKKESCWMAALLTL
ncbi:hypothetical protein amad1_21853 (plasmid) [Alteromonas mediterranea DE1]|jgi:hypothetical protein|uniref:Uncharacterized protein n=1 Tax=Alteromonas mediterranea TaxID=314275 RepID=A0AAC8XPA6_9ALTE|nr:hypothetical protein amad1_20903 [Alteromonas mediterranea DE1]AGP87657.1 hypothetical protein I607_19602 [Alteromonas mediterranea U4]AGP99639.1 hypothetical protein I635_20894 [Alteromonas mediterranea UM7]AMJ80746.1 hypothetical protein AV942_20395 [Alteromonas mediterranea]AFV87804.1 hypothetical protein amad1_21853 [Alteromonas mediterranea DE1]|tara:strand:+ start:1147 stop:1437 length:291 start_codon:yes stop_codon:yes gene_type:complete